MLYTLWYTLHTVQRHGMLSDPRGKRGELPLPARTRRTSMFHQLLGGLHAVYVSQRANSARPPTLTVSLCAVSFHCMSVVTSSTSALPRQRLSRLLLKKGLLLNENSTVGGPPLEGYVARIAVQYDSACLSLLDTSSAMVSYTNTKQTQRNVTPESCCTRCSCCFRALASHGWPAAPCIWATVYHLHSDLHTLQLHVTGSGLHDRLCRSHTGLGQYSKLEGAGCVVPGCIGL